MQAVFLDISALGFNLPALIAQLINFLLLLLIFRMLLYKPLLKMLDERKKRIQEGLDASDEAKRRLSQTEQEVAKELEKARQQVGPPRRHLIVHAHRADDCRPAAGGRVLLQAKLSCPLAADG